MNSYVYLNDRSQLENKNKVIIVKTSSFATRWCVPIFFRHVSDWLIHFQECGLVGSLEWTECSPDLTNFVFFLCDYIKSKVYAMQSGPILEPRDRITEICVSITLQTFQNDFGNKRIYS